MVSIVPYENSFVFNPSAKLWSSKNEFKITDIWKSSNQKVWLDCINCTHSYIITACNAMRGHGCVYCNNLKLCDDTNCRTCHEKSFASSKYAIYWDKNKNIVSPRDIFKCSAKCKYWFICQDCNHEFDVLPNSITTNNCWCPYCKGNKLCNNDECKKCFEKSFASTPFSKYWSNKNELLPRQVIKSSAKQYLFKCSCGHESKTTLYNARKKNDKCKYCVVPSKTLCDDENCKLCYEKSFASSLLIKYWDINKNIKKPRQLFKTSQESCWFKCENNHSFQLKLSTVAWGNWCKLCSTKTENKLLNILENLIPIKKGFRAKWCISETSKKCLPFDFVIEKYKIIIELDGDQHFKQVLNWRAPKEQQLNDKYKMVKALENGYSIIRLLQMDVYMNKYDYKKKILETIEDLKNKNKPSIVYLCINNEYDIYKT